MQTTVYKGDDEFEVTIEWSSEPVTLDNGRTVWEVTDWWVSEVDGKTPNSEEAADLKALLDEQEIIGKIEDWEA